MVWTKYKLMPQDIAVYLFLENASHKRENEILSDLFENIEENKFNIIVSNPPYIRTDVIKELSRHIF